MVNSVPAHILITITPDGIFCIKLFIKRRYLKAKTINFILVGIEYNSDKIIGTYFIPAN